MSYDAARGAFALVLMRVLLRTLASWLWLLVVCGGQGLNSGVATVGCAGVGAVTHRGFWRNGRVIGKALSGLHAWRETARESARLHAFPYLDDRISTIHA